MQVAGQELKVDAPAQTMEDILSSIRKIINDETAPAAAVLDEEDVLELTQEVQDDGTPLNLAPPAVPPVLPQGLAAELQTMESIEMIDPNAEEDLAPIPDSLNTIFQGDPVTAVIAPISQQEDAPTMTQDISLEEQENPEIQDHFDDSKDKDLDQIEEALVSRTVADASVATLTALSRRVNRRKTSEPIGDQTVDQLMRSVLKPLVREWLDDHLPQVVERIVSREVARLVQRSEYDQF